MPEILSAISTCPLKKMFECLLLYEPYPVT